MPHGHSTGIYCRGSIRMHQFQQRSVASSRLATSLPFGCVNDHQLPTRHNKWSHWSTLLHVTDRLVIRELRRRSRVSPRRSTGLDAWCARPASSCCSKSDLAMNKDGQTYRRGCGRRAGFLLDWRPFYAEGTQEVKSDRDGFGSMAMRPGYSR